MTKAEAEQLAMRKFQRLADFQKQSHLLIFFKLLTLYLYYT